MRGDMGEVRTKILGRSLVVPGKLNLCKREVGPA